MTFPASEGSTAPLTADRAWDLARDAARGVKSQCQTLTTTIAAGPTSARLILDAIGSFLALNAIFNTCKAVPKVDVYAQSQVTGIDIVAEFTTMQNALTGVLNWVSTNFPKDGSGNLLFMKFDGTQFTYTSFTSAQLAGFVTQLNGLSATIA